MELEGGLHLLHLHVLHVGTAPPRVHLLLLTRDVHAGAKREIEEVIASWGGNGRGGKERREKEVVKESNFRVSVSR